MTHLSCLRLSQGLSSGSRRGSRNGVGTQGFPPIAHAKSGSHLTSSSYILHEPNSDRQRRWRRIQERSDGCRRRAHSVFGRWRVRCTCERPCPAWSVVSSSVSSIRYDIQIVRVHPSLRDRCPFHRYEELFESHASRGLCREDRLCSDVSSAFTKGGGFPYKWK